jgi:hypothetical protein
MYLFYPLSNAVPCRHSLLLWIERSLGHFLKPFTPKGEMVDGVWARTQVRLCVFRGV